MSRTSGFVPNVCRVLESREGVLTGSSSKFFLSGQAFRLKSSGLFVQEPSSQGPGEVKFLGSHQTLQIAEHDVHYANFDVGPLLLIGASSDEVRMIEIRRKKHGGRPHDCHDNDGARALPSEGIRFLVPQQAHCLHCPTPA